MKKMKICFLGVLTLIASLFCFVACGGVTGKYGFKSITTKVLSSTVVMEEGQKYQFFGQLVEYDEDDCTIELREDGTAEIYMDVYGASQDMTCEWEEIEDGKIVFTQGGIVIMTATVSGRTMTVSIGSDTTIILKK